jgi:hypothetical protein
MLVVKYQSLVCTAISYGDEGIKLSASALDGKFDFCIACAKNMETGKTHFLLDKPGIEKWP